MSTDTTLRDLARRLEVAREVLTQARAAEERAYALVNAGRDAGHQARLALERDLSDWQSAVAVAELTVGGADSALIRAQERRNHKEKGSHK